VPFHYRTVLVGLVINPVAGMGGSVALKGTDGEAYGQALKRGAVPIARDRAMRALSRIGGDVKFLTASGEMGAAVLSDLGIKREVVYNVEDQTGAEDTRKACAAFLERNVDLIIFCGGDGTARDVLDVIGENVPVVGIPSGVKMHSAAFANTPEEAGDAIMSLLEGAPTRLAEVMDVDEEAFRSGELKAHLYGYLRVPETSSMQPPKGSVYGTSDDEQKAVIADHVVESMEPGTLYVLGPGTTTKAIADRLGQPKTLLGVDIYLDGRLVQVDVTEKDLLGSVQGRKVRLILTPIGRQGFVLGRGNQQISPKVVQEIGTENIQIIATTAKLREISCLRSDSGNVDLDRKMGGYQRVLVGYSQYRMVRCA
jgi:predicted polyphosphate/ATP-dependent NAD kinase